MMKEADKIVQDSMGPASGMAKASGLAKPLTPRRIVLTGFMGSGKSTVGPLLGQRLGWRFVDVDDVIEAEAGCTIAELFARHGEGAFLPDRDAADGADQGPLQDYQGIRRRKELTCQKISSTG